MPPQPYPVPNLSNPNNSNSSSSLVAILFFLMGAPHIYAALRNRKLRPKSPIIAWLT